MIYQVHLTIYYTGSICSLDCFIDMFKSLGSKLLHKGSVDKDTYWNILSSADIVLSTAKHEFYGVSM